MSFHRTMLVWGEKEQVGFDRMRYPRDKEFHSYHSCFSPKEV